MRALTCISLLLLGSAALGGCPAAPGHSAGIQHQKPLAKPGEKVSPGALPAGWPDYLPAYPGGKVIEGRELHSAGVATLSAVLSSADQPQKIADFYSQRASNYGYKILTSSQAQGALSSVYKHDADSLLISVARPKGLAISRVVLKLAKPEQLAAAASPPASSPAASAPPAAPSNLPPSTGAKPPPESGVTLLPIYPGSTADPVKHNKDGTLSLRMTTSDASKAIQAYYDKFYVSRGLRQTYSINADNGLSLGYSDPPASVDITIGPLKEVSGQNEVWLILNSPPPSLP